MTNLDELEELLRSGKDEEAYKQIKEDRGITAEILIDEGITFGTLADYSISISYFKLAEKIAEDDEIIERVRVNLAVSYNNRGTAYDELKKHEKAIEDYNKAIALNPEFATAYANRGMIRLLSNEDLYKAIADFKCARVFFEGQHKERMLGFKEWAEARNAMNKKNWAGFRERMNDAKEYFDKINDPLSYSLDAFIKLSYPLQIDW